MINIIGYAENNLNSFAAQKFNAVDSLLLSQFSYLHLDCVFSDNSAESPSVCLRDLLKAELFDSMFREVRDADNNRRLLFALAASPRFRNTEIRFYKNKTDPELEQQFCAVTYFLQDGTAYIAYRGTDATFVGWKEDFNMAFMSPVPSQEESAKYINDVAKRIPEGIKIRTGGHSKGGNLAVYSAVKCDPAVKVRIIGIFNHDGPGFRNSIFESSDFAKIKDRIFTTLPESSLIGMLLEYYEDYSVVKSSRTGIMQHDPFSWLVNGGDFYYAEKIKAVAMYRNRTLNQWLSGLNEDKRKQFIDTLFYLINSTGAVNVNELSEDWRKSVFSIMGAMRDIDPESKKIIAKTINELVRASFNMVRNVNTKTTTILYD
jgi:hypothetical protein